MQLSIITVTYNSQEKILQQIKSVKKAASGLEYEQIISDNGSRDNTVNLIKQHFPEIKIIENKKNLGFGAANNKALKYASGEFLLFLNPDMKLHPNTLSKIVNWMRKRKDVGIASCLLTKENKNSTHIAQTIPQSSQPLSFRLPRIRRHRGAQRSEAEEIQNELNPETTPRRFPTVWNQLAIILKIPHIFPQVSNKYLYKDKDFSKEQEVDSVRGSFMLMRRKIVEKLGWAFDPRYFIWFEDVDICREAKRLGYKVVHTPIISAIDYFGTSFAKLKSLQKQKWFLSSMLIYFKKWI